MNKTEKFVEGAVLVKGKRTKEIVEIGYVQYDIPGVLYKVKDGTTRYETMEAFTKWMEKAERTN